MCGVPQGYEAGCYDGHECTPYIVAGEERETAALLKRAISISPDQAGIIQLEQLSIFILTSTYIVMSY